jgi:hypothetical protein
MLPKKSVRNVFYKKVKMLKKKGAFVVESLATIGSFDYDYTH